MQPVEPATVPRPEVDGLDQLADEDTTGAAREEIEAVLADDGSLWDPLPMTLPTYVNKARARRTVRTIELTGINSSGHDAADTALAREAQCRRRVRGRAAQGRRSLSSNVNRGYSPSRAVLAPERPQPSPSRRPGLRFGSSLPRW